MKKLLSFLFAFLSVIAYASFAYGAAAERIFDEYKEDIFEDAKAPMNEAYIKASMRAMEKQGKIKKDEKSIGGIIVEKGATIYGPISTDVDMHGGNIFFDSTGSEKGGKSK